MARYTHFTNLAYTGILAKGAKGSEVPLALGPVASQTTIAVGAEASSVVNVAVQYKDAAGADMAEPVSSFIYFSDDAAGQTLASVSVDTLAIGTDGTILVAHTAGKAVTAVSETDGDLDFNCTKAAADTLYMQILMPDGTLKTSSVLTWT